MAYFQHTVLLLKSFHTRRSLFLITGRHNSLHDLTCLYAMFREFPIKIFLLKSKKWRQLRQSNLPPLFARRRSASYWAILTNTNPYIQEIWVLTDFLNIRICICQNGSVAPASKEGGMVALSHLPTFLGVEQKYFYGELVQHWIWICQILEAVVPTSYEKKAPPYMEQLQKEHCSICDCNQSLGGANWDCNECIEDFSLVRQLDNILYEQQHLII